MTDDAMLLGGARAVADQAAGHGEFTKAEERGQPVAKSHRRKSSVRKKKNESAPIRRPPRFALAVAASAASTSESLLARNNSIPTPSDRAAACRSRACALKLKRADLKSRGRRAGEIATGPAQTFDEPERDRIGRHEENDRMVALAAFTLLRVRRKRNRGPPDRKLGIGFAGPALERGFHFRRSTL